MGGVLLWKLVIKLKRIGFYKMNKMAKEDE